MTPSSNGQLILRGLDGANPLGFLAAIGTLRLLGGREGEGSVHMGWEATPSGWRPALTGFEGNESDLGAVLYRHLARATSTVLDIGLNADGKKGSNKFPFGAGRLKRALADSSRRAATRPDADFLAALGSDLYPNPESGEFQCTTFKMVRRGDSNGQGMLHYAKAIRDQADQHALQRALFDPWRYRDEGYSLRWDPIENQSYALRWRNPSTSRFGTEAGANCLAFEALPCLPCAIVGKQLVTTGFGESGTERRFVWPIWNPRIGMDAVRSLLSLNDLHQTPLRRDALEARGVAEVFGATVIRPNQYYSNFAPAQPIR